MAKPKVTLELTKRVECLYFTDRRADVEKLIEDNADNDKLEIISLWAGMSFVGFAIMTPEQYDYFSSFLQGNSAYVGFYDGVTVVNFTPEKEVLHYGKN